MRRPSRHAFALAAGVVLPGLVAGGYVWGARNADFDRREEVAARGAAVMPFDLDRTTHVFDERENGGAQTVVADDPGDTETIENVRLHLEVEAHAFSEGRFDDPTVIHGREMPGLAELRAGADRIEIRYEDVPAGGRITFATREPELVEALHAWFEAQLSDHGEHATTTTGS